jgi:hypothetical protein
VTEPQEVDAFRYHSLWGAVEKLKPKLETAKGRTPTDRHTLARSLATLVYLGEYKTLSPYLFQTNRADQLQYVQQYVTRLDGQFQAWDQSAGMDPSTVRQMDVDCDAIMTNIADYNWPALKKESRAAAIAGAADAFRVTADASLSALQQDVQGAQEHLADVRTKVSELQVEAEARTEEAKTSAQVFEDALEAQDTSAKQALAARVAKFDSDADAVRAADDALAQEHLQALKDARAKAAELLAFVTDGTVAGGYSNFSKEEKLAYRYWNSAGIAVTLVVVGYLFWEFRDLESLTSEVLWVRTLLSVPALGVSAYCFQQASKRHRQFIDARYRALDLVALPPFSDSMQPDEQSRLRMVLGERLFAREEDGPGSPKEGSTEDAALSPTTVQSLTELLKLLDAVTSKRP